MTIDEARDDFGRMHRIFTFHLGVAVGLSWMTALYASIQVPWVRNIRALIDPVAGLDRVESTWSFLFVMPVVLTVAWVSVFLGREMLRRSQTLTNVAIEFAAAALVALVIFYLSIDRAVAALYIGI